MCCNVLAIPDPALHPRWWNEYSSRLSQRATLNRYEPAHQGHEIRGNQQRPLGTPARDENVVGQLGGQQSSHVQRVERGQRYHGHNGDRALKSRANRHRHQHLVVTDGGFHADGTFVA